MLRVFSMLLTVTERYVVLTEPLVRRASALVDKIAVETKKNYVTIYL